MGCYLHLHLHLLTQNCNNLQGTRKEIGGVVIQNQISLLHGRQWKDPVIKASVTLAVDCLDETRQSIDGREFPYLRKLGKKKP
jgi:hypothetical protein